MGIRRMIVGLGVWNGSGRLSLMLPKARMLMFTVD